MAIEPRFLLRDFPTLLGPSAISVICATSTTTTDIRTSLSCDLSPRDELTKDIMTASKRPIRVVGVSGFAGDPATAMYRNASAGPVDAIIGDYLAEFNLAINAIAAKQGSHPGWEQTFMDGTKETLDLINAQRIKLVTNGGALNPRGAAQEIQKWIDARGYTLRVAFVEGDNVTAEIVERIKTHGSSPSGASSSSLAPLVPHLDGANVNVKLNASQESVRQLRDRAIISANCYLGSRAITAALNDGADIVVCGRVADASPVMGLAAWWHGWKYDDERYYDALAGALVAGHLIECSGYSTGGNFSGFERYAYEDLTEIGFPIAEIRADGATILTKQDALPGLVNVEVIACQFLYELQGNIYLNSDVKARLDAITMTQVGHNRVLVENVKGHPPPPTTKAAIFWVDGYQVEYMISMTGSNHKAKSDLFRHQTSTRLKKAGLWDKLIAYEVQDYGTPAPNASTQFAGTSFIRIFIQAPTPEIVVSVVRSHMSLGLGESQVLVSTNVYADPLVEHFSGYASTIMTNPAQAIPRPFLGYYPGLWEQSNLQLKYGILSSGGSVQSLHDVESPSRTEAVGLQENYDSKDPIELSQFGETVTAELGSIVIARSGDKGGNINIGLLPRSVPGDESGRASDAHWDWLRTYLSLTKMQELIGDDWRDDFSLERVEFPGIKAVHFVVYGILGRGVTSSPVLDNLGKGFADWIRSRHVQVPKQFLNEAKVSAHNKL